MKRTLNTTIYRSKSEKNAEHKRFKAILTVLSFAFLPFTSVQAAEYTLDLRSAVSESAEEPVLRRASMPVAIGAVPAVSVGDSIDLWLFDDVQFALSIVSAPPAGIAGQSFIAKDRNGSASAVVKVSPTKARISVDDFMKGRQYSVRVNNGIATIVERDNSHDEPGECGTCGGEIDAPQPTAENSLAAKPLLKSRSLLAASDNAFPLANQKSVVDILVAFDKGAKAWAEKGSNWGNGGDSIEEFADYAVSKMNMVLEKSQLLDTFSYRLAGVTEIEDTYVQIDNALLGNLRARVGALAKLTQLREKYGADTITLLIDKAKGDTTGIGYGYYPISSFPTPASFDGMNYACNVCDIKTVYSRYTMSHETGHNMGCDHSTRQGPANSGPGRFADSSGYHFVDANGVRRYTIMGYNYTADDDYNYLPVPYFSSPDIAPDEYGCAVGVEGTNNNRRALLHTHADIAGLREHTLAYDWDARFLDDNGKDIPDGSYFYTSCDVTLTSSIPDSEIYYTVDGSTPTQESSHGPSGTKMNAYLVYGPKTITASVVTNGVALSVRSITLRDGLTWRGDENGNGVWASSDSSEKPWSGQYFYGDSVVFPDLAGISSATVTVQDAVSPASVSFQACETAYTFDKGSDSAQINISDAVFAPAGDLMFNVPVKMDAVAFTNIAGRVLTFNAPFGQTLTDNSGYCTNLVTILPYGKLTVAPGVGKTQTFDKLNNTNGGFSGNATFRVGVGTVFFVGRINGGAGVIGRTKLEVGNGGELVFNMGGGTGFQMEQTSLTVEKGGIVRYKDMEHLKRALYLDGGTIYAKRLDLMGNPGVYARDDSSIENNGGGYILIRDSDSEINVSEGKSLTLNVGTQTDNRSDTSGWGMIKRGKGTIAANAELKHSGVTDIEEGTIEVGYSSGSTAYGLGWIVASNSTLRVKSGCTLKVPLLTLDPTSIISLPAATSAPLVVNGNVDLTDVRISIQAGGDLSLGASYPLVSATGDMSGVKSLVRESWPKPGTGLGWKVMVVNGTLTASIVNAANADPTLDFITNISDLRPALPSDATMTDAGGLKLASSPIAFDNLNEIAVSITLDVTLGEPTAEERTICSWKIGNNIVRCVLTNGVIDCFYDNSSHFANSAQSIKLSPGRHTINIGYKSLSDDTYGGTFVYADGQLAYRAAALRWSNDKVSRVTIGASAAETPAYKYDGLVVNSLALLTSSAKEPLPNMTSSGGAIKYDYFAAKSPCVFATASSGGFSTHNTLLSAAYDGSYDEMSVSVVAAFPETATGTIMSSAVKDSLGAYSTQIEYQGSGTFAFRDNGYVSIKSSVQTSVDVSDHHLYTMTYKIGEGFRLYLDGEEILTNESYFKGKSLPVFYRVLFGCGYWTNWMTSYNDNPNPMSDFTVYASHIALGTSEHAISEVAVLASLADDEEPENPDEPEPPEAPAVVDVLVAYDLGAQAYVGGKNQSLEDFAATQIQKMNDVLATNRLERFYSYRLAGVCKVNDTYDNIDTAPAQAAGGNGAMVSLRAAREIYGADTVTLLVDTTGNTLGNSSPLNSPNNVASQHECAFSVCSIRAVDTGKQHTMIHENAHNMGCGHARAQSVVNSPFEYGRGYYFKDGNVTRHTIMAYGGDNDASWYFSTSSSKFGFKLGDETNDNARVLRETCSEVAKWREDGTINLDGSFASGDAVWQTGKRYPWSVDGEGFIRSYNQTEYGNQCTTPLKATVAGPAKILFKHKSYFGGVSVAGNNYSHFDVLMDDSPVLTQTECTNSWTDAVVEIPEGDHEVTFVFSQRYAMNNPRDNKDVQPEADDAVWLKDISIVKKPVKTDYNFEIPGTDGWVLLSRDTAVNSWLNDQNFWMYEDDMSWQEFMDEKGSNGYYNWENFLLGYSAEDPTQKFSAKIKVVDGKVTVETNEVGIPDGYGVVKRIFKKASLDSDWDPPEGEVMSGKSVTTDAADQGFYKVKVSVEPGQ